MKIATSLLAWALAQELVFNFVGEARAGEEFVQQRRRDFAAELQGAS